MTALGLIKSLKHIKLQRLTPTCAPISELPSNISTLNLCTYLQFLTYTNICWQQENKTTFQDDTFNMRIFPWETILGIYKKKGGKNPWIPLNSFFESGSATLLTSKYVWTEAAPQQLIEIYVYCIYLIVNNQKDTYNYHDTTATEIDVYYVYLIEIYVYCVYLIVNNHKDTYITIIIQISSTLTTLILSRILQGHYHYYWKHVKLKKKHFHWKLN